MEALERECANDLFVRLGALIDWNYRRLARKLDFPVRKNRQTDISNFPIEKARMQIALPLLLGGAGSTIGYGWLMDHKVPLAGPIIMLFILGYCLIAASQVSAEHARHRTSSNINLCRIHRHSMSLWSTSIPGNQRQPPRRTM